MKSRSPAEGNFSLGVQVAYLYYHGRLRQQVIAKQLDINASAVSRILKWFSSYVEIRFNLPTDHLLGSELMLKYGLKRAFVVEGGRKESELQILGQTAAEYFSEEAHDGDSVALSCGATLLEMVKAIKPDSSRHLTISQLSIEGDPETMHHSPSTLCGLLRSKCGDESTVYGLQLPPFGLVSSEKRFREELRKSKRIQVMRKAALHSRLVFIGIGNPRPEVGSRPQRTVRMAGLNPNLMHKQMKDLGIVAEVNNRFIDAGGVDRTSQISGIADRFINVLSVDDLRTMAGKRGIHSVVAVASGLNKADAIHAVLRSGIANIVITTAETAQRLLQNKN